MRASGLTSAMRPAAVRDLRYWGEASPTSCSGSAGANTSQ